MVQRTNKTIDVIAGIDEMITKQAAGLSMEDDEDRAKMAWWIYQTFCKGDYRRSIQDSRTGGKIQGIEKQ